MSPDPSNNKPPELALLGAAPNRDTSPPLYSQIVRGDEAAIAAVLRPFGDWNLSTAEIQDTARVFAEVVARESSSPYS